MSLLLKCFYKPLFPLAKSSEVSLSEKDIIVQVSCPRLNQSFVILMLDPKMKTVLIAGNETTAGVS